MPLIGNLPKEYSQSIAAHLEGDAFEVLKVTTSEASLLELFGLKGYWPFYTTYLGDPYHPYADIYSTNSFTSIGFLIPLFVFFSDTHRYLL